MSDLGQLLRKARVEKKISLEDLQETTKIRKRYLEAIEDGNYKVLPGNFYVRAFIKSYAEAVGLDPNEVLNMYQNVIPQPEPEQIEPIRTKRTTRNTEWLGKWASNVMVISFVVLILGVIYYYMSQSYTGNTDDATKDLPKKITEKVEPATQTPNPGNAGANGANGTNGALADNKPVQVPTPPPTPPPTTEVKLVKSERGTDYYAVTGTDKLKIEMKVTGDSCWIEVDSPPGGNKKVIDSMTFNNGETKTWELTDTAFLIFGKANAVELSVNGSPVVVGDQPNVKKIQVDIQKS
ncbi:XRE family transcriptional regulator [Paenibacillus tyrfis]|uniref:helix-turn-helix domain-containing protein n=1 Tax=Paenibacillus TaxID=44249 RepID=UPI0024920723|nr:helix-turn-helix domain-containing protein [Paenibacillus tyrfis]GLI07153.1 XRE family transcriptional regulator [Paenibacillus tyrfis]GMX62091.1 helix-turn-helix domain-containing protein [Paenibacillus elgii]